jgi:hypothetical protein
LILGTLTARRAKENIKNHRGIEELPRTNPLLGPRRAVQRFECCSRVILDQHHNTKKRIDVPSLCATRFGGAWAGVMGHC